MLPLALFNFVQAGSLRAGHARPLQNDRSGIRRGGACPARLRVCSMKGLLVNCMGLLLLGLCPAIESKASTGEHTLKLSAPETRLLEDIQAAHAKALHQEDVVGATFSLASDGALLARFDIGYADREQEIKVNEQTIFHWASVTKTFTSIAIMQLVERGLLSLDAVVIDYLPEISAVHNPFGPMDGITVRHLLSHSAGLRSPSWPWNDEPDWQPYEPRHWSQLVAMMPYTEILFEPGTRFGYSNLGIIFLGQIIERVSGDDIEVYIDKNILKPLGMYRSYFDRTPWHLITHKTLGYFREESGIRSVGREFDTGITAANGGLNAPASDMMKFANFLAGALERPSVLKPETLALMYQPLHPVSSDEDREVSVGLGFFVADHRTADGEVIVRWVGHSGYQLTHRSSLMVNPADRQVFVAAANTVSRPNGNPSQASLRKRLLGEFFPAIAKRGPS